ncbi:MAG: hypothetical protein DRP82_06070 [Planctomycetota bacterium]|nr:MAG: hypothetical protein DRP82_06070 [Planctomycetota bacterium]
MLRWLLVGAATLALGVCSSFAEEKESEEALTDGQKVAKAFARMQKLKKMTSFLNLLNGLYLSKEQMEKIVAINEEYKAKYEEWARKNLQRVEEWERTLEEWVEALKRGELPRDLMRKAGHVDHMLAVVKRNVLNRVRSNYKERLEAVFTDAQKEVIRTFKPCVTPPRDLRNPIRAGQANAGGHATRLLVRLRQLPPHVFWRQLDKIVERHITGYSKAHPMTEEEKAAERKRLRQTLIKIYRMDDVDFEMQKEKLAKELKVRDKAHIIRDEIKRLHQELQKWQKKVMPGNYSPVVRWFLNPEIVIPVLKERIARMEQEEAPRTGTASDECSGCER